MLILREVWSTQEIHEFLRFEMLGDYFFWRITDTKRVFYNSIENKPKHNCLVGLYGVPLVELGMYHTHCTVPSGTFSVCFIKEVNFK